MWENFSKNKGRNPPDNSFLRIYSSGAIHISPDLYAEIGKPSHIQFHWHRERKTIGITPAKPNPHAYTVNTKGCIQLTAIRFLRFCNLLGQRLSLPARVIDDPQLGLMIAAEVEGDN